MALMNPEREDSISDSIAHRINRACEIIHATAKEKGWWDVDRSGAECIALMHSELSEALEYMRKPGPDDKLPQWPGEWVELADCMIRIMDYCGKYGIPIGDVIAEKHEFNTTRPYRHGKVF